LELYTAAASSDVLIDLEMEGADEVKDLELAKAAWVR
jgi:hypothetical protein